MPGTVKVSVWIGSAVATMGMLVAVLTYNADRAESATNVAVTHESRHVRVESDVERIDGSMVDNFKIIQSQLAAEHQMNLLILGRVMKE